MTFQLGHLRSQSMAHVFEKDVADEQEFFSGAPLVENNDGELEEIGSDEYGVFEGGEIDGIALARYGVDGTDPYEGTPSFDILGGLGFEPGRMQAIQLGQGDRKLVFSAEFEGDIPDPAVGEFGIVRGADRRWRVNFNDTDNTVVRLEDAEKWAQDPINKNRVLVSFLAADASGGEY